MAGTASSSQPGGGGVWNRSEMIKAEIEELRPLLRQHQEQRHKLLQELGDARAVEQDAKRALELSRLTQQEKRRQLRKTLQCAVDKVIIEQRSMKALTTPSPELHVLEAKLNEDLRGLRRKIHGLKYSQEDQDRGAARIQNWWRCILQARVRRLLQISKSMWELKNKVAKASLTIQRWYRASIVRFKWRAVLDTAMERRRKSLEARLEHQTKVVKVLQRAIRIYLAKRRLARKQEDGVELVEDPRFEGSSKYVDNWRPASERREVRDVRDGLPQEDLELTKMKDAGLIPFYSRTSNTIRHRIGGPFALKIQFQLGVGLGRPPDPADPADAVDPPEVSTRKSLLSHSGSTGNSLGGNWEIYPQGISQGFLESLTYDYNKIAPTSPVPRKPSPRKARRRPVRPRPCTKPVEAGPLLTQRRAEQREQQQQEETAAMIKAEAIKAVAHLQHPLLEGLLPNVPMHVKAAPPSAPPGRPRPSFGCGSFRHEESSWDATSFYCGRRRSESAGEGALSWRHM